MLAQICSSLLDWTVTCGGSGNYLTGGKDKKKKLHTQRQRQKAKTKDKDRGQRRESFEKKKERANRVAKVSVTDIPGSLSLKVVIAQDEDDANDDNNDSANDR